MNQWNVCRSYDNQVGSQKYCLLNYMISVPLFQQTIYHLCANFLTIPFSIYRKPRHWRDGRRKKLTSSRLHLKTTWGQEKIASAWSVECCQTISIAEIQRTRKHKINKMIDKKLRGISDWFSNLTKQKFLRFLIL